MGLNTFPICLKSPDGNTFFKIDSATTFEELRKLGAYYSHNKITANTLPDRNYLADLIEGHENHWEHITATTFEQELQYCSANLSVLA